MQKVEGSSPFIRSRESLGIRGFFRSRSQPLKRGSGAQGDACAGAAGRDRDGEEVPALEQLAAGRGELERGGAGLGGAGGDDVLVRLRLQLAVARVGDLEVAAAQDAGGSLRGDRGR